MNEITDKLVQFPQADDFNKIMEILNVEDEDKLLNKTYISKILGEVSERQVSYYLSAAMYLGILNTNRKFTEFGISLRMLSTPQQQIGLCIKIISNPIFGALFFGEKIIKMEYENDDVVEIMKINGVKFESETMFKRRAQTVISWVKWINSITAE